MSVASANLPYKNIMQSQVFNDAGHMQKSEIDVGAKDGQSGGFKAFMADQTESFLKETKEVEKKVTQFSEGKLDIEAVASEVATMSVKIEAAKRTAEELKTGMHSLLNMQM
jgi:hypothetical protein